MAVQPGLCRTWSETPKTGFLTMRLTCFSAKDHRITCFSAKEEYSGDEASKYQSSAASSPSDNTDETVVINKTKDDNT